MNTLRGKKEAGGVIVIAVIVASVIMALTMGYFLLTVNFVNSVEASVNEERALQIAEAGIDLAADRLNKDLAAEVSQDVFGGGQMSVAAHYWGTDGVDNDGDGDVDNGPEQEIVILTSLGYCGTRLRRLEAVLNAEIINGPMLNAIYAGNASGDPNFSLDFGGTGDQGDQITGDIYSGQDILIEDDAEIDGVIHARGNINGRRDNTEYEAPITRDDLVEVMNNYPEVVVDLNAIFASQGVSAYDVVRNERFGGTIVPESSPAHIFRLDPNDRVQETSGTDGPDFFLEDPYEVNAQGRYNVNNTPITMSSVQTGDPEEGNDRLYYIKGNLWVHNRTTYDFVVKHPEKTGIHTSVIVEGNIYICDNLYYNNQIYDMMTLMALKDPDSPETTGNVYLGDPIFGTLEEVNSFMYAENDFHDLNLDERGSYQFMINGSMTAGNHVLINRDYERSGTEYHSRMDVNFDTRLTEESQQAAKFRSRIPQWLQDIFIMGPSVRKAYWVVSYRELSRPSVNPFVQDEG